MANKLFVPIFLSQIVVLDPVLTIGQDPFRISFLSFRMGVRYLSLLVIAKGEVLKL